METRFDKGNDSAGDPIDRVSSRPDYAVVVYPGFPAGMITVPKDAPQTFLVCADDDRSHVVTTVNLYLDLEKQGVPSELHIYTAGGHGFALRPNAHPVASWGDRLQEWMIDRKLMAQTMSR
jgi:endo-1,4-beta-xylanase